MDRNNFQALIFEKAKGIAYITLNRPEALNTYNIRMRDELCQVLYAIQDDDEINVVVLRGAGEKAFCAGADLSEFLTAPSTVIARQVRWERDVWGLFWRMPQPFIAALHGYVLGSGVEIALCCDLRIASPDARFGLPEVGLGIIPAAGGTQTLPRTIGPGKAFDLLLTNRWIGGEEAYALGLVQRIVPKEKLWSTVDQMAQRISSYDPVAVRAGKRAVLQGLDLPLEEGLALEKRLSCQLASKFHETDE